MTIRLSIRALAPALAVAASLAGTALAGNTTDTSAPTHKPPHAKIALYPRLPGYKTLSQAKSACGGSPVVWHARGSKVFHVQGSKYFGKTRHGAYVCEEAAKTHGLHKSKH